VEEGIPLTGKAASRPAPKPRKSKRKETGPSAKGKRKPGRKGKRC